MAHTVSTANHDALHPRSERRLKLELSSRAPSVRCLLLLQDETNGAEVASVAVRAGVEFRASRTMTTDVIAYALRNHLVVVLVPADNAIAPIQELMAAGVDCPILVLERDMDDTRRAVLLAQGAAACEELPISERALARRLVELGRRAHRCVRGPMWFDQVTHRVGVGEREVQLSAYEFLLLRCLAEGAGEPVSISRLRLYAWGGEVPAKSQDQIVAVHICRLRKKLQTLRLQNAVFGMRGRGYVFKTETLA